MPDSIVYTDPFENYHPISSAPMEGTNNKIKTIKRQTCGYRGMDFFKLRIMDIYEAKYALTG